MECNRAIMASTLVRISLNKPAGTTLAMRRTEASPSMSPLDTRRPPPPLSGETVSIPMTTSRTPTTSSTPSPKTTRVDLTIRTDLAMLQDSTSEASSEDLTSLRLMSALSLARTIAMDILRMLNPSSCNNSSSSCQAGWLARTSPIRSSRRQHP